MQQAEQELLSSGIAWFDEWNSNVSGVATTTPSCYFATSDVPVASGHIHQARYCLDVDGLQGALEPGTALVCLHGFGAGVGIYYAALPALRASWEGPVFALDWFGCSLSSRPKWMLGHGRIADPSQIERFFIDPLEQWRIATGVERMVIVGHSLGGYLAGCYAARFPERVEHLVLASPAGVTGKADIESQSPSLMMRLADMLWSQAGINPLMAIWHLSKLLGRCPLRSWFKKFRNASWLEREKLAEYHYQSTQQGEVSGAYCLTGLLEPGGSQLHACSPLSRRLSACPSFGFIYGTRDHLFDEGAPGRATLTQALGKAPAVARVAEAGHDMMVDNPLGFAEAVTKSLIMGTTDEEIFGDGIFAHEANHRSKSAPCLSRI
jgi:pimeloyl-ACP methyl ester carboxylesterase